MEENKTITLSIIISAIIVLIGLIISNNNKQLTTNLYVTNTYLYILLAILFTTLTIVIMEIMKLNINNKKMNSYYLYLFFISIIIIITFAVTSTQNVIFRHILFILFTIAMGIFTYPIYVDSLSSDLLYKSIATVFVIVIGLTIVTNQYPKNYFDNWGPILIISLSGLIIFELFDLLFSSKEIDHGSQLKSKIFAMIGTAILCGFIVYDTKKIYQHADQALECVKTTNNNLTCTDYPSRSLGLYLTILNLFSEINRLHK